MEIDQTKVITLKDILKLNEQNTLEEQKINQENVLKLLYSIEEKII